jgi:hypothetical protein
MRARIESIQLIGTKRDVEFSPGLNIITGPIASGKTTLIRLCHGLFGTGLENFPLEVRQHVAAIGGRLVLGDHQFSVVRPFTTTKNAKIDISGLGSALRLPALVVDASASYTYGQWLLRTLGLPDLRVPSAPSRPDSDLTPVSINDFFLYCVLSQETIDNSVFGHRDPFKNVKRKYVFEVLYGIYSADVYRVQERLHQVNTELGQLASQESSFKRILAGTPWENRAVLIEQLHGARNNLAAIEERAVQANETAKGTDEVQVLGSEVLRLDEQIARAQVETEREVGSVEQLNRLIKQLGSQSKRLTKTIIAKTYLTDFEFILCPRCGATMDESRAESDVCSLCLQVPAPMLDRKDFISEQDRVAAQIEETEELLESHKVSARSLERRLIDLGRERERAAHELDFKVQTYVSDSASAIAQTASERPAALALITRLEDYLRLYDKLDNVTEERTRLELEKGELEGTLEVLKTRQDVSEQRIKVLEENFEGSLRTLAVPRFSEQPRSALDRKTYLPIIDGRRFDDLSSQGLQTLVNVAYAIAHQKTAIQLSLPLPNILMIDGLTTNVGQEGYDLERVHHAYKYLIALSKELGDTLQIIVADGNVPPEADAYVRLRLSEEDRLIPLPTEAEESE